VNENDNNHGSGSGTDATSENGGTIVRLHERRGMRRGAVTSARLATRPPA